MLLNKGSRLKPAVNKSVAIISNKISHNFYILAVLQGYLKDTQGLYWTHFIKSGIPILYLSKWKNCCVCTCPSKSLQGRFAKELNALC